MELYGWKAWALLGVAVAGWVLAVLFLLGSMSMLSTNRALYLGLYECEYDYYYLYRNYTALARTTLDVLNQAIAVINATGEVVNYNAAVLNATIQELNMVNQELASVNETLYSVNQTLAVNNYILYQLYKAAGGGG